MTDRHPRTLGSKIAADFRLLNHLRARPIGSIADIEPGSSRIEVDGGVIASRCEEDHEEVLTCWAFYRAARPPD